MTDQAELYKRQLGFYDPREHRRDHVGIIGLGGIGSFAAFGVAKLGVPNITIVDDDTVELHNVPNQFHARGDVGVPKATATRDIMNQHSDAGVESIIGRIGDDTPDEWKPRGVIVSGVDSMRSRKEIWEHGQIKFNPRVIYYIDARIAGQLLVIYAVNVTDKEDCDHYELTLHDDSESVPASCTERGVIDVGLMAGAMLTNMVRHALTGGVVASVTTVNLATTPATSGDWVL